MTITLDHGEIRSWKRAVGRGLLCRCPACGEGRMFAKFMKVADACNACGAELHHQRADDAPPYFTMFIVGHIIVPLILIVEKLWAPELWVHAMIWFPLTIGLTLALMPPVKGAVVGLQWALKMNGFALAPEQARD